MGRTQDKAGLERLKRELERFPLTEAARRAGVKRRTARDWVDRGLAHDPHTPRRGWREPVRPKPTPITSKPTLITTEVVEPTSSPAPSTLSRAQLMAALAEMIENPASASGPRVQAVRLGFEQLEAAEAAEDAVHGRDEDPLVELDRIAGKSAIGKLIEAAPNVDGWRST